MPAFIMLASLVTCALVVLPGVWRDRTLSRRVEEAVKSAVSAHRSTARRETI